LWKNLGGEEMASISLWKFLGFLVVFLSFFNSGQSKRQPIEEVAKRQLDNLLTTEDYLAVFWRE